MNRLAMGCRTTTTWTMDESTILQNIALRAAFFAWLAAQIVKFFGRWHLTHRIDFSALVATGGMPSSHSALVSALATGVGLIEGFGSTAFAISFVFAGVVMFDAQSVRRAAGNQARLLNQIIDELFKQHSLSDRKLVELLGHTPVEVFFGMALGVAMALAVFSTSLT